MAKTRAKKEKEVTLETIMWNCRVVLRNKCSKSANRDTVLALVFLKFAGDKFEQRRQEIINENGENRIFLEKASFYQAKNVFYLNETSRWSYIIMNASRDDIAILLDQAMADIEEKNSSLKGALPQRFFSNLGVAKNDIKALIDEINKISEQRFHEKDLIGRVYEYFLQNFAIDEAQEKGEFYTPKFIVDLIAELIEPYKGKIYDPCCGSGGMFVQSVRFVDNHKGNRKYISVYGQESNPDTYRLARMNLAIRGIAGFLLANGALNADGDEYNIRKQLVENDKIEAIIVLPREMFYSTDISVTLWILNNNKKARLLNDRNVLSHMIDMQLIKREGKAVTNFTGALPPGESDMAEQTFKDPYLFDFIGTAQARREAEVERALVDHMEKFLLELGQGFAFVGRQVHMEVGGDDFYIDLLFYHLKLRYYIVVELKTRDFEPGDVSQLNMYQNIVNDILRHPDDKPTIGLLLVKGKNRTVVEYSLSGYTNPIGVADWKNEIAAAVPDDLKSSLPTIEEIEREMEFVENKIGTIDGEKND
ncbi:type I restriction-modification system, DNA-methyltransferase [Treponema sp. R8-4-B8]